MLTLPYFHHSCCGLRHSVSHSVVARDVIYISRLCYDASVRLSVRLSVCL